MPTHDTHPAPHAEDTTPKGTREQVIDAASKALDKTRETASTALETTRDTARDAAKRTADVIDSNPLPILIGGLAVGALAAALLPRSERELALLAPVGKRLADTAAGAVQAGKEAGRQELDALGLSKSAARDQVGKLLDGVLKAVSSAGTAAVSAAKPA